MAWPDFLFLAFTFIYSFLKGDEKRLWLLAFSLDLFLWGLLPALHHLSFPDNIQSCWPPNPELWRWDTSNGIRAMEVKHFQWEFLLGLPRENYYPIRDASAFLLITGFPPKNIKVTWVVYNYTSFYEPLRVCSSLFSLWLLFPLDSLQIYRQVAPKSPSSGPSSNFVSHKLSLTDQLP